MRAVFGSFSRPVGIFEPLQCSRGSCNLDSLKQSNLIEMLEILLNNNITVLTKMIRIRYDAKVVAVLYLEACDASHATV